MLCKPATTSSKNDALIETLLLLFHAVSSAVPLLSTCWPCYNLFFNNREIMPSRYAVFLSLQVKGN